MEFTITTIVYAIVYISDQFLSMICFFPSGNTTLVTDYETLLEGRLNVDVEGIGSEGLSKADVGNVLFLL